MTRRASWVLCAAIFGFITLAHGQFITPTGISGFWDYQTNYRTPQYIRICPNSSLVHTIMMVSDDSLNLGTSRRTAYAFSSNGGSSWTTFNQIRVPPDRRSGFPSLDIGQGLYACDPIISNHNTTNSVLQSIIYIDDPAGTGNFTEIGAPIPLGFDEPGFPEIAGAVDGSVILVASRFAAGSAHRARTDLNTWSPWEDLTLQVSDGYVAESDSLGRVGIAVTGPESPLSWYESTNNGITWPTNSTQLLPDIIAVGSDQYVTQQGLDLVYRNGDTLITFGVTKLSQGLPTASHQGVGFWSGATGFVLAVSHDSISSVIDTLVKRQVNQNPVGYPAIGLSGSTIVIAFQAFMAETSATGFNHADIFFTYSSDGGASWSHPENVTQSSSLDERYPSMSKWNPPGEANFVYQEDPQPGAGSFGDGSPVARLRQVFHKKTGLPTDVAEHPAHMPTTFALLQNYPNPFNPLTTVLFDIPLRTRVNLVVYNLLGQLIATLVDEERGPGRYQIGWDASSVASGVYLYRLTTNSTVHIRKMLVVK